MACICRPAHAAALALGRGPNVPQDVAAVWAGCERLTQRVAELVSSGSASDGVRLAGIKFLETAVLALTADMSAAAAGHSVGPAPGHALLKPMEVSQSPGAGTHSR